MNIFTVDYAVLVLVLLYNAWSLLAKRLGSKKHWKVWLLYTRNMEIGERISLSVCDRVPIFS